MILKSVIRYAPTNSVEATWVDADGNQVKCHSYDQSQMDMLRTDLGADAPQYESLIQEVLDNWIPPTPDTPEQRWEKIKSWRDSLILTGGAKVGTKWFHSDTHSKVQQLSLLLAGASLPAGIQWKTMDGTFIEMTPTLAQQIYQAQMAQEQAIFQTAEVKRLDQSDIYTGWPETYQ